MFLIQCIAVVLAVLLFTKRQSSGLEKLKAFADDKFIVVKMMISLFDWEENIMGKDEMLVKLDPDFKWPWKRGLLKT